MKQERKREALYNLLARGLCHPREQWSSHSEVRKFLRSLQKAAEGLGLEVAPSGTVPPEDLAVEHARLFAARPALQPTASARLHGTLMGPPALRASDFYKTAGFLPRVGEHPDHIVTEMCFLAALCDAEARSRRMKTRARDLQREFLESHLLPWAPGFFRDLALESHNPLYRALGLLGESFLKSETRRLFPERFVDVARRDFLRATAAGAALAMVPGLATVAKASTPPKPDPRASPEAREALDDAAHPASDIRCGKCGKAYAPPAMIVKLRAARPDVASHAARFCPECRSAGAGVV